jgi:hypothetical protein
VSRIVFVYRTSVRELSINDLMLFGYEAKPATYCRMLSLVVNYARSFQLHVFLRSSCVNPLTKFPNLCSHPSSQSVEPRDYINVYLLKLYSVNSR